MDRTAFYKELRRRDSGVFGTSLNQKQVDGCEAVLDECLRLKADLGQTAYLLGTAYLESGRKMYPTYENLNYSARRIPQVFSKSRRQGKTPQQLAGNPELLANTVYGGDWGRRNLGNLSYGDGWKYRGTGMGQITGRANFTKWGTNLGLPLVDQPELLMRLDLSVKALVRPMLEGWATGEKLGKYVSGDRRDYLNARRTWNGMFHAREFRDAALSFERALAVAGYDPSSQAPTGTVGPEIISPASIPPAQKPGFLAAVMAALSMLFIRKG